MDQRYDEGMEKGMEKGIKLESERIVMGLLYEGVPVSLIMEATGFSMEKIEELRRNRD